MILLEAIVQVTVHPMPHAAAEPHPDLPADPDWRVIFVLSIFLQTPFAMRPFKNKVHSS